MNLYAFVQNSPIDAFDAYGQTAQKDGEILIEIKRWPNIGRHSIIGIVDVSSKGFESFLGVSLELKEGKYDLEKGWFEKKYPIPSGEYEGEKYWMHDSFAVKLKDKKGTGFKKLNLHVGAFPWHSEGCILIGNYFKVNYYFERSWPSIYRTLSEHEWNVFVAQGMITKSKTALKYETYKGNPSTKKGRKYLSPIWEQKGYTDRLYESKQWFDKLEKYYNRVVKKHGESCVSFKISVN